MPKESERGTQETTRKGTTEQKPPREDRIDSTPVPALRREAQGLPVEVPLTTYGVAEEERSPSEASVLLSRMEIGFVPQGISVRHLDRLMGGLLLATSPRVDWAKLLRRTYAIDVLTCPRCGGRMRLMAAITDKATARKILSHLGLLVEPVKCRARDPTDQM
jgi:hypothetical protein